MYTGDLSDLVSPELVQSALSQAYGKILRLWHHILTIRTLVNSSIPISRLPSEILLRIFHFCTYNGEFRETHWLAFSQVCTRWRRLALEDPTLWTYLDFGSEHLARLMYARAEPLPVHAQPDLRAGDLLPKFLPDPARIISFQLTHEDDEVERQVGKYLVGEFPSLETLSLTSWGSPCTLKAGAFTAPHVHAVSLYDWVVDDLSVPWMRNLTSLTLEYSYPGPRIGIGSVSRPAFTAASIVKMLSASPMLRSLTLRALTHPRDMPDEDPKGIQQVNLAHLKSFSLVEEGPVIIRLLPFLALPATRDVYVYCPLWGHSSKLHLDRFLSNLYDFLQAAKWTPIRDAQVKLGSNFSLELAKEEISRPVAADIARTLYICVDHPTAGEDIFLRSMVQLLFHSLVKLTITISDNEDGVAPFPQFLTSLAMLPSLQDLSVDCETTLSIIGLLTKMAPRLAANDYAHDDIPAPSDPFPALRQLKLSRVSLVERVHGQTVLAHLVAYLDRRKLERRPVVLVLKGCRTVEDEEQLLERVDISVEAMTIDDDRSGSRSPW